MMFGVLLLQGLGDNKTEFELQRILQYKTFLLLSALHLVWLVIPCEIKCTNFIYGLEQEFVEPLSNILWWNEFHNLCVLWGHYPFLSMQKWLSTATPILSYDMISIHNIFAPLGCLCCELFLGLHPANERRRYKVTPSLIGCAQT